MTIVSVRKAKAEFAELIKRAHAGEGITIARNGKAVARLVPVPPAKKKPRLPGTLRQFSQQIPDSATFQPLPDDELDAWEGKYGFGP